MFLRQNILYFAVYASGCWGSGVLSGVVAVLLMVCEFSSGWDGYILRSRAFQQKKQRFQKNVMLYNFFTFLFEKARGLFRALFGGYEPARGRKGLYITLISVVFWSGRASARFQACFLRGFRPRLPSCGRWWVLSPSSCVKLWEGRVIYTYIIFGILSIASYFLSNYRKSKKYSKVSFYIKKQAKIITSIPFYP